VTLNQSIKARKPSLKTLRSWRNRRPNDPPDAPLLIITRLNSTFISAWSDNDIDTYAAQLATWLDSPAALDAKSRPPTHCAIFESQATKIGDPDYVRTWTRFAQRMRIEWSGSLLPFVRFDIVNNLNEVPAWMLASAPVESFERGAASVGYDPNVVWGGNIDSGEVTPDTYEADTGRRLLLYKTVRDSKPITGNAVLTHPDSWEASARWLCEFALSVGATKIGFDWKLNDHDPDTGEEVKWATGGQIRPCPVRYAYPPGTAIDAFNRVVVMAKRDYGIDSVFQNYEPTLGYACDEALTSMYNYGSSPDAPTVPV